jgi:hypothetical protein
LKIIEQQLLNTLRETPFETDCSVSADVLRILGLLTPDSQRAWLNAQRPLQGVKTWHLHDTHWLYAEPPAEPDSPPSRPPLLSIAVPRAPSPPAVKVKPVLPLRRR